MIFVQGCELELAHGMTRHVIKQTYKKECYEQNLCREITYIQKSQQQGGVFCAQSCKITFVLFQNYWHHIIMRAVITIYLT